MQYLHCEYVAARMLCGDDTAHPSRLNRDLSEHLKSIDYLCGREFGNLYSRQVIAVIVYEWCRSHPDARGYD